MKKTLKLLLIFLYVLSFNSIDIKAREDYSSTNTVIEDLGNNCYLITTIEQKKNSNENKTTKTISGSKKVAYMNGNTLLWSVQVNGSFSYTGSSAKYIKATVTTTCPSTEWKITSKSASKSNNIAIAKATGKKYFLGVCIQTVNRTVSLKCSNTGKLS